MKSDFDDGGWTSFDYFGTDGRWHFNHEENPNGRKEF